MRQLIYLFLFILLTALPGFSQSSPQTFTTKEGDQFQIEFKLIKETVMLGEPAVLLLEIKNLSEQNLMTRITEFSLVNGKIDKASCLTIIDADGKIVSKPLITKWGSTNELINSTITSAKSNSTRKLLLSNWADFRDSGNYTINLSITFYAVRSSVRYSTLFQADFSTTINITQPDYTKMGEVIDSLGITLLDENNLSAVRSDNQAADVMKMLDSLNDERIIPYLVQALNVSASLPDILAREDLESIKNWVGKRDTYSQAAKILIKYNNYEATEALENAINSQNLLVRNKVANILSESKNPRALDILLKFINHKDTYIRLTIVNALSNINTEKSNNFLREMLKDENQSVRNNARRILDNRAQK